MIRRLLLCAALIAGAAGPAPAQEDDPQQDVSQAAGAVLRGLDKVSGVVTDFELVAGAEAMLGYLTVRLGQCRFPTGNPAGDAYAWVEIEKPGEAAPIFAGWMVASSPALSALDHPRYDVWVLRCTTE